MRLFNEIPENPAAFKSPILTIGNFDGVHGGHQKILQTLMTSSIERGEEPVVLTFDAHPKKILTPATPPKILTTQREKIKAISDFGIEKIIILKFTKEIADMTAVDFLNKMVIEKIGAIHLVVGYDHAFGKDRSGDYNFLKLRSGIKGFEVTRVEPRNFHSRPISSTWIRAEIEDGNISFANMLLGRHYTLFGKVIKGEGRGVVLGYPTANILPEDPDKVIPKDGVYAAKVVINSKDKKEAMLNIGTNPTFANMERTIEVNIFDFEGDLYNKTIEIDFYERIRGEVKFKSADELKEQIGVDKIAALKILQKDVYNYNTN